ncbi:MAG: GDSL-type esterase/lipase family protein [Opitutaceae bacterium]
MLNPSFERMSSADHPRYFSAYFPSASSVNPKELVQGSSDCVHLDDTVDHSGKSSLKLSSMQPARFAVCQDGLPTNAGMEMRVTVWMKADNLEPRGSMPGALFRLGFGSPENPSLNAELQKKNAYLYAPGKTFDWTRLTTTVRVPEGTGRVALECFLWESSGTVWFDDLSVEIIGGPNEPVAARDPDGLLRYQTANAELPQVSANARRVIFFGDSITDLWNLDLSFPGKGYINRGIGGQDTDQMVARLRQDVLDLHPRVVWFLGGTNDMVKGFSNEATLENIRTIAQVCRQNNIRLIICSILPVSDYHQDNDPKFARTKLRPATRILELNRGLQAIANEEQASYLDLHSVLADKSDQMPADLANDGLHPTAAGYAIMAPVVAKAIRQTETAK